MHFNLDTHSAPIDDKPIEVREHQLWHKSELPITVWNPMVPSGHDGIVAFNGKTDPDHPCIYAYLGVANTKVDHIDAKRPRASVHVYEKSFVDSLDATKGEHYINADGYVAQVNAIGESIVHIYGHVCRLVVSEDAQVMLYEGCYVDDAVVYSGALRINEGASVYCLNLQPKAKVVASTQAAINRVIDNGGALGHFTPAKVYPLTVSIHFNSRSVMKEFCKTATEEYRQHCRLKFLDFQMERISNCTVNPDFKGGYDVRLNAEHFTDMSYDEIKRNINNTLSKEDSVVVWINGKSSLDAAHAEWLKKLEAKQNKSPQPIKPAPVILDGNTQNE